MKTINVEQEIISKNREVLLREGVSLADQKLLDAQVEKILTQADAAYYKERDQVMSELGFDYKLAEACRIRHERETFAHLPAERIMSLEAIKATCLKFGLRFLPTRFYRGALDEGIGTKLDQFRAMSRGELPKTLEAEQLAGGGLIDGNRAQFYIAAPSESFVLQLIPKDPLLFCRLSLKKFFLIHKWGDDLNEADVKKHDIGENNWNSQFEEKNLMDGSYHAAMQAWAGQTQNLNSYSMTNSWSGMIGQTFGGGGGGTIRMRV